jgi:hypothetical protein
MTHKTTTRRRVKSTDRQAFRLALVWTLVTSPFVSLFGTLEAKAFNFTGMMDGLGKSTGLKNGDIPARSLPAVIGTMIYAVLGLLGVVFLVLIIGAGVKWMTSGDNEEAVGSAKKMIVNATIGVVIVLAAYAITWFILDVIL